MKKQLEEITRIKDELSFLLKVKGIKQKRELEMAYRDFTIIRQDENPERIDGFIAMYEHKFGDLYLKYKR